LAQTEIIVEVQADIQIRERSMRCSRARAISTPPSAISGRCGHTFGRSYETPSTRAAPRASRSDFAAGRS
jgi:hypothetical protein